GSLDRATETRAAGTRRRADLSADARKRNRSSQAGIRGNHNPPALGGREAPNGAAATASNTKESLSGSRDSAMGALPVAASLRRSGPRMGCGTRRRCALSCKVRGARRCACLEKIGTYFHFRVLTHCFYVEERRRVLYSRVTQ